MRKSSERLSEKSLQWRRGFGRSTTLEVREVDVPKVEWHLCGETVNGGRPP